MSGRIYACISQQNAQPTGTKLHSIDSEASTICGLADSIDGTASLSLDDVVLADSDSAFDDIASVDSGSIFDAPSTQDLDLEDMLGEGPVDLDFDLEGAFAAEKAQHERFKRANGCYDAVEFEISSFPSEMADA